MEQNLSSSQCAGEVERTLSHGFHNTRLSMCASIVSHNNNAFTIIEQTRREIRQIIADKSSFLDQKMKAEMAQQICLEVQLALPATVSNQNIKTLSNSIKKVIRENPQEIVVLLNYVVQGLKERYDDGDLESRNTKVRNFFSKYLNSVYLGFKQEEDCMDECKNALVTSPNEKHILDSVHHTAAGSRVVSLQEKAINGFENESSVRQEEITSTFRHSPDRRSECPSSSSETSDETDYGNDGDRITAGEEVSKSIVTQSSVEKLINDNSNNLIATGSRLISEKEGAERNEPIFDSTGDQSATGLEVYDRPIIDTSGVVDTQELEKAVQTVTLVESSVTKTVSMKTLHDVSLSQCGSQNSEPLPLHDSTPNLISETTLTGVEKTNFSKVDDESAEKSKLSGTEAPSETSCASSSSKQADQKNTGSQREIEIVHQEKSGEVETSPRRSKRARKTVARNGSIECDNGDFARLRRPRESGSRRSSTRNRSKKKNENITDINSESDVQSSIGPNSQNGEVGQDSASSINPIDFDAPFISNPDLYKTTSSADGLPQSSTPKKPPRKRIRRSTVSKRPESEKSAQPDPKDNESQKQFTTQSSICVEPETVHASWNQPLPQNYGSNSSMDYTTNANYNWPYTHTNYYPVQDTTQGSFQNSHHKTTEQTSGFNFDFHSNTGFQPHLDDYPEINLNYPQFLINFNNNTESSRDRSF